MATRGYIDGLICSDATDTDHDISIAAGSAKDSTNVYLLTLASALVKQIDASWAAGTNAGGLDTGSVAANTVYYIWIIRKDSDGSIDGVFSLSKTAPTMPSGYTYNRRIMTVCTDASANIINFDQVGDDVFYRARRYDRALAAGVASRTAYAMTVPPNMIGNFVFRTSVTSSGTDLYGWVAQEDFADVAPAVGNADLAGYNAGQPYTINKSIKVNASRQIYARVSSTNMQWAGVTLGWIDDRGRDA
jgi:hypothetical protein